jgi:hypothetical protein
MARVAFLFGLLGLCWLSASVAEACSYAVPRKSGESEAHAYERLRRETQDRYWDEADTIFVGRVVGLRQGGGRLEVNVLPRSFFKGDAGTGVITYDLDGLEVQCDRAAFPDFDKVGVFYANHENDQLIVRGMLGPKDIRDEALRARVIDQLEPGELTSLAMETPAQDHRPLIVACLAALVSFLAGLVVGWRWRKIR